MKYYFAILPLIFLALSANLAHADTGALFGAAGGSVAPYQEQNIKMDSEHVSIIISKIQFNERSAEVSVDYVLRNTSNKPVTVLTGFPERDYQGEGGALKEFRAFIEGKEVLTQFRAQDTTFYHNRATYTDYTVGWHTYILSFTPNQTLHVKNSYHQDPYGYEGSRGYGAYFEYILDTGASWQGAIDEAVVDIELKDDSLFDIDSLAPIYNYSGAQWTFSPDFKKLSLTLSDIKPTVDDNIVIKFDSAAVYNTFYSCNDRIEDVKDSDNPEVAVATSYKPIDRQLQYRLDNQTPEDNLSFEPTDIAYFPCKAADSNKRSAWISGNLNALPGKNQVLTLRNIPVDRSYVSLYLLSGFITDSFANDKNHNLYRTYSRPKKIKLSFFASKDETRPQKTLILNVPDDPKGTILPFNQWITAHGKEAYINLEIVDVYKGEKYSNIAIAEVNLNGIPAVLQELTGETNVDLKISATSSESKTMAARKSGFKENTWKYICAAEFSIVLLLLGVLGYNYRRKRQD